MTTVRLLAVLALFVAGCPGTKGTEDGPPSEGTAAGVSGSSPMAGSGAGAASSSPDAGAVLPGTAGTTAGGTGQPHDGGFAGSASPDSSTAVADGGDSSDASLDASTPDSVDDYTGDCGSARWSTVSEACWSCWCTKCSTSLDAAPRRSLEIFECMFEKDLLVGNLFEIACEIRAGQQECVHGDTAAWDALVTFDQCLIGTATFPKFRACETECGVSYPGDVCTRYP